MMCFEWDACCVYIPNEFILMWLSIFKSSDIKYGNGIQSIQNGVASDTGLGAGAITER